MKIALEVIEGLALDGQQEFSLTEVEAMSGLTQDELQLLVECQALFPLAQVEAAEDQEPAQTRFSAQCLVLARIAARLRRDFDLDANATMVTLQLLKRIQDLENELLALRAQMPSWGQ